jgi:hypothetical protein
MRTGLFIARTTFYSFGLCMLACTFAQAQEPAKIIDQYLKAEGGRKALSKIQTLTLEGTFPATEGHPGTYTFYIKAPNRYYSELLIENQPAIVAYNGKSAWHQDSTGDPSTLLGDSGAQLEAASQYYNSHLLDLKKAKIAVAFIGHAQVSGKDTLQLELTNPAGLKRELFFDPQSHLLIKESAQIDGVSDERIYSDFRPESGIQLPHALELHRGAAVYNITMTHASINATVGERVFDFPKKSQVQLPDLKALFKEIDDNQKAIDKIKENYAGTRVEDETEFESDGRVKKHEVNEYTFFYFEGDEISTLVKKRRQASERRRAEERKRENPKKNRGNPETPGQKRRQGRKRKGRRQGFRLRRSRHRDLSTRLAIRKSPPRKVPWAGCPGVRLRAQP